MKNTALTKIHMALGAKMVTFAGFNMPVYYSGINNEHDAVRNSVGVFDVSHMGEFIVRGEKAIDLLQKITSNDVSKLVVGKIQYTYLPNDHGGIIDDLLLYKLDDNEYMLVVNASNVGKDWDWIQSHNSSGVEIIDISDQTTLLAVQGPNAAKSLQSLTDINLGEMKYYTFKKGVFAGIEDVLVSATGYTGAGGFEIYFDNSYAEQLWNDILRAGETFGIKPVGLAARDTLRLEMGYCLYGNDIDETTSPIEAGLGWITKFNKDFVNSKALFEQKNNGVPQKLVGFELIDRGIPRHDHSITNEKGELIGRVTSGTMSPSLKKAIGMGYIKSQYIEPDTEIFINIRNQNLRAKVVALPFYKEQE